MKNSILTILTSLILILSISCSKDESCENPIECLPAKTTTGEGTFGCLVNGKAFVEKNNYFNCYYQFVDDGFYFSLSAEDENQIISQIIIGSVKSKIEEGEKYNLSENSEGNHYGECSVNLNEHYDVTTKSGGFGFLEITKFDEEKRIVSGIFEFDIINPETGEIIKIREGRFDTLFTM
ncbi:hypothetical protein LB465_13125 [Salegentibacter sp. LM13S]|uniref:hypothetical protein n=1 Tax=Salegentibacter lacus TaxID=2873599 RepID=UPI001CCFDC2C|nr:hypothetical protein [Salegentibacter lacus]MBZ9631725.1 hypothetical protein [Salegentibacter lacus]